MRRHRGRFPAPVVVRIWREMLAATSRLQGPLSVAVHAPKKSVGYWDMVRDHYGSATRISLHRLPSSVLRAVVDGTVTVGVLPMPCDDDTDPWWPKLTGDDEHMPRVIARVPFIENKNGRFERLGALAIARTLPGESGDDISLVAVEASTGISRASLKDAFEAAGMSATEHRRMARGQGRQDTAPPHRGRRLCRSRRLPRRRPRHRPRRAHPAHHRPRRLRGADRRIQPARRLR